MIKSTLLLIIVISVTVISEENHDDTVSIPIDGTQQKINIACLCTEDEQCDSNTRTCRLTHPEHVCYETWTKENSDNSIHLTAGCIYNEFIITRIMCNGNQSDRFIICCSDKNYCNDRDQFASDIRETLGGTKKAKPDYFSKRLMIIIIILSILLLVVIFVFIAIHIQRKRNSSNSNETRQSNRKSGILVSYLPGSKHSISNGDSDSNPDETPSNSNESRVLLSPGSFATEVTLEKKIGFGAYGTVYRGIWHNDPIAVKIRLSNEECSWIREVQIYEDFHLNHQNILRYIAADNIDSSNGMELWIGTEYHENGSVYDYLNNHTITVPIMITMMYTIADGLFYLHKSIVATNGKPALAHRDIKTKNILVKDDLSCCIADLGLAVREIRLNSNELLNHNQEPSVIDITPNRRVGTIRYMAPEILDRSFNGLSFESYKAADLYALGLVYWEILRRCQTTPEENDADVYQIPYVDVLPNNPTFEQMQEVLCIRKIRPPPSPRWKNHSIFSSIFGSCEELWAENPACRPSSCVIKEQLRNYRSQ
ncbi:unnamed protein product [Rotaria socialis]|uniref:receptor protein serine/threonine kinase n=1 Tax=Rotaria socialis TaxID=392032 RepID=A0A817R2R6_9BILA|nr:unnamed protein product [Rotaria socialis]